MIPIKARVKMEEQQSELTQLRARVRELEERLADQVSLTDAFRVSEANFDEVCDKLKARIRELEEAMPDASKVRWMAGVANDVSLYMGQNGLARPLNEMADRINAVMRKEGNE